MGFHPDFGNVPSWIGAGSLLLAFRIFLRDRSKLDHSQVDAVGVWGDIKRQPVFPGMPRTDDVEVQIHIRNATDLPVEIQSVAFSLQTKWMVPALIDDRGPGPHVWNGATGKADSMRFINSIKIAPQKTWDSEWTTVNLTHTAPAESASLLFTSDGVKCAIAYTLIIDNAGRRWEAQQRQGKPARRIHWYSRSREHYPVEWQNALGRTFRILRSRTKARIQDIRTRQASITSE